MRKTNLGILAALAIAALPMGAQQPLQVKIQKAPGSARTEQAVASPILAPATGTGMRADVKSAADEGGEDKGPRFRTARMEAGDVYFNDFADHGESMKIFDVDGNGKTWLWNTARAAMRVLYDKEVDMDDWMITQGIQLEAGKYYYVSADVSVWSASYPESLEIRLGNAQTVEAMTTTVWPKTDYTNTAPQNFGYLVSVPTTGTYYIGVHACSPKGTQAVYFKNLRVAAARNAGTPQAVADLKGEPIGTEGKVTLTCTTPAKALDGSSLGSISKIEFWRDLTPIKTIENPAPGSAVSFVDECGGGKFTWKAVVTNAAGASLPATYTATIVGPHAIPYIKDFPELESLADMTIIDVNNDSYTWDWNQYQKYAEYSHMNQEAAANDWLITPPLILKAGKVYEWSSLISCGNPTAFPPMVRVCLGTANTADGMTQELLPKTKLEKFDNYIAREFTVPADGLYHLGVQACSEEWLALIKLMNINVIGGAEAEGPAKVSDALIEADWSGRTNNVDIAFKAPTKTGTDKDLSSMTKIDIMRQGIVVHTFDNPTPGQAYSWTDKDIDEAGDYLYRIVPYNTVGQGGVVEQTITVGAPGLPTDYLETFGGSDAEDRFAALTLIDANNDGTTFWHATQTDPPYAWLHYDANTKTADDYLITPGIALTEGTVYTVSADAWGYDEGFELLIGTAPKVDSLHYTAVPHTVLSDAQTTYSGRFTAPYTGKFYIAARAKKDANRMSNFQVTNIGVTRVGALTAPGQVEDFTAIASAKGSTSLGLKFKAPTKNIDGSATTSLSKIEVARNGAVVKTFDNPAPGTALECSDDPGTEGEYTYVITPYTGEDAGAPLTYLGYAGFDLPATPSNIHATEAGDGKVKITWDPVTTTAHGAQTSDQTIYVILELDGLGSENQLGQTTKTEYTYQALEGEGQKHFYYGVFPFNTDSKQGRYGLSDHVFVGDPYTISFMESFENGAPASPIMTEAILFSPEFGLCTDETFSDLKCSDGDNGFIMAQAWINNIGRLSTGKISLAGAISPTLSFNIANINPEDYTNEMGVEVCEAGTDNWTRIATFKIREKVPAKGWGRVSFDLSAYKGKVIRVGFVPITHYTDDSERSLYKVTAWDAIRVHNLTNKDLGANITASADAVETGNDVDFTVTVSNNGEQAAAAYRVDLCKNGKVVDSLNGTNLAAGRNEKFAFSQSFNVADPDQNQFYAVVTLDGDENTADNTSRTVSVAVNKPIYPTIAYIKAKESTRGTISVEWGAPSLDNVPPAPYKETFESAESWNKTGVGGWTFVDVDDDFIGGFQQFTFPGLANDGTSKASFFVVDKTASELGQFASLFAGNNGSSKSIGSLLGWSSDPDDWAVSPELYGGAQTVTFYAKNLQDNMPEKVELWYSTGSTDTKDFIFVRKWNVTSSAWEKISAYLPKGAKRVAIRHNYRGGILQVDDIEFRRAGDQPESITLKGYNIFRDGEKLNDGPIAATSYTDTGLAEGEYTYAVNPVYDRGEGNAMSVTGTSSSVGGIDTAADVAVYGAQGGIDILGAADMSVSVVTTDGRTIYAGTATEPMRVSAQAGIYLVKVGDRAFKVTVK